MRRGALLLALVLAAACQVPTTRADSAPAGMSRHDLRVGDETRRYHRYRPPQLPEGARPLVVVLHGGWGTGTTAAEQTGFNALADRHGFHVIYPDGFRRSWNAGSCCDPAMGRQVDDVGFIRELVLQLRREPGVDARRVYATGFSNGAMMVHRLACETPELFAAIAPVAGGVMVSDCARPRALPALLIQGRDDPRIPWDGGLFEGNFRPSMAAVVQQLASRNGCGSDSRVTQQRGPLRCERREGCDANPVEWCGLSGVGHQWPGGRSYLPRLLGPNTDSFDTSAGIWLFFSRHSIAN